MSVDLEFDGGDIERYLEQLIDEDDSGSKRLSCGLGEFRSQDLADISEGPCGFDLAWWIS
jgi:hypothetical protein